MNNSIIENRICNTLAIAGIERDAEIIAIASALQQVDEIIKEAYVLDDKLAINLLKVCDGDNIAAGFGLLIFDYVEKGIIIRNYDISTIGNIVAGWMPIFEDTFLDGNGYCWDDMDECWQYLDSLNLRWTMIESR